MQYGTPPLGAARGPVVYVLWAWLWLVGVVGCGGLEPASAPALPVNPETSTNSLGPELSAFSFEPADNPQLTAAALGRLSRKDVQLEVPFGTDVSALVPRIEIRGERVEPASGEAQDFSAPVTYVVTAQDGTRALYTVTVNTLAEPPSAPLDSTKEITRFSIGGVLASITADTIELTVPHDTRLRNITPELAYSGAALAPRAQDPQDFTQQVVYSVMAQDGSTRSYTVNVTVAPNNSRAITHFRIAGFESVISGADITLTLPAASDLTQLVPAITLSGGTVSPPSGQVQDFSKPVRYTVTGADGATQTYTVRLALAAGMANDIVSFAVPQVVTTLHGDNIELSASYGTSSCSWAPNIEHAGVRIEPASGTLQDFTQPVLYTVTAGDGTERRYSASCHIPETSARGIGSFEVLGLPATITGDRITLTVPNATSLGALTPTIKHYGVRLSPASEEPQSFYAPVEYVLLEPDGTLHTYTATIVLADRADKELVELTYAGQRAHIAGDQVTLTMPFGSDLHAVAPTLLHRGARVVPVSGTPRDFSAPTPLTYTVIARDGTRRDYAVHVVTASVSDKQLRELALLGAPATFHDTELSVRVPYGSDLRALAPSELQYSGASVSPPTAAIQDFSKPVSYIVTAADGSMSSYVVHASVSEASANEQPL